MNTEAPLNASWIKGRMLAMGIMPFSIYNNMKINILKNAIEIILERDIDKQSILNKSNEMKKLQDELGKEIIIVVYEL
jgi:hypothetical protein